MFDFSGSLFRLRRDGGVGVRFPLIELREGRGFFSTTNTFFALVLMRICSDGSRARGLDGVVTKMLMDCYWTV